MLLASRSFPMFIWWLILILKDHQQIPPYLGFSSSSRKGWFRKHQGVKLYKTFFYICRVFTVYCSQGNIWSEQRSFFLSTLSLEVFVYFWKENLAYLYPHRCSQNHSLSFIYLTWGCLVCNKFFSIHTLHLLPGQNGIQGEECHTLRSKTWKVKALSTLTGILLIRGTMGYHFLFIIFLSYLIFFQVDTEVPLILLPDTCPFFSARLSSTCSFLFPRNIHTFA